MSWALVSKLHLVSFQTQLTDKIKKITKIDYKFLSLRTRLYKGARIMDMNALQSPEDLLADESFLAWYHQTDSEAQRFWEDRLNADLTHRTLADSAIELMKRLDMQELPVPAAQLGAAEDRLFQSISAPGMPARVIRLQWKSWRVWVSVAACVAVVLLAAFLDKNWIRGKATLATGYGQMAKSVLPDGTEVTLNAHSTFTYGKHWEEGSDREVWLQGEAFFHVRRTAQHDRFIVHAGHFDVIVTGTMFNVVNQPGEAGVVLQEGSVTLLEESGKELKMMPGDNVVLKGTEYVKQTVNPEDATAWMENKMSFDNTPMSEVIRMIEGHYGVKVEASSPKLLNQTLNGIFPNDNLDVLLKALQATKEYRVIRTDDRIVLDTAN
jgi:transmembrane sensor